MDIGVLGPFEVRSGGEAVELPGGKARLLLAALVERANRVVSVDRCYEILWGPEPPETAANTLQTYVAHLRRALEPQRAARQPSRYLITRDPGYVLEVDADQVDAARFERLAREGRAKLGQDPEEAAALLRQALDLWRGEPYADFTFEPFAQADITRLGELRLGVREDRIAADLALGGHLAACGELAELVVEHPLREGLWGQLMVALYRSGRQADALAAFARLKDALCEQLGIDPSPELCRLEAAILRQDPDLDLPARVERTPAPLGPRPPRGSQPEGPEDADPAAGMAAVARREWATAFRILSAADLDGTLGPEELNGLAEAALWTGHPAESLSARQRAHVAFLQAGAQGPAAMMAVILAIHFAARLRLAVAGGWLQRAQRLVEGAENTAEHAFVVWCGALFAMAMGDPTAALAGARQVFEVGRSLGVADLEALGLAYQGYVLVHEGRIDEGFPLLDEGMTWAVGGELNPLPTALIFCRTITTCYELGDFRRASEWMEAIEACYARTGIGTFPGDCEAHRIGILAGRGAWSQAETEAREACACLEPFELTHVGQALCEIGEIRLRCGDLDGAAEAFARAAASGARPYPGMALLHLARGDVATAAATIGRALAGERWDRLARTRLLPAQIEIALAAGDLPTAAAAAEELAGLARAFPVPAVQAAAACARGAVQLAEGDAVEAAESLTAGVERWRQASAPYDAARARILLAEALRRSGDAAGGRVERAAARAALEVLGAALDLRRLDEMAAGVGA